MLDIFKRMTAGIYRRRKLEESQLALLEAQCTLEYWRSQVAYHKAIIKELSE